MLEYQQGYRMNFRVHTSDHLENQYYSRSTQTQHTVPTGTHCREAAERINRQEPTLMLKITAATVNKHRNTHTDSNEKKSRIHSPSLIQPISMVRASNIDPNNQLAPNQNLIKRISQSQLRTDRLIRLQMFLSVSFLNCINSSRNLSFCSESCCICYNLFTRSNNSLSFFPACWSNS